MLARYLQKSVRREKVSVKRAVGKNNFVIASDGVAISSACFVRAADLQPVNLQEWRRDRFVVPPRNDKINIY